jgi:hypothetical protein
MKLLGTSKFAGQYPEMLEFQKPWESTVRVSQGFANPSYEGIPLWSDGFSKCVALILRDSSSLDSILFHISTLDMEYPEQTVPLREYMLHFLEKQDMPAEEKNEMKEAIPFICKYWPPENMTREEFTEKMALINADKIKGCFIYGRYGRGSIRKSIENSMLNYFNIKNTEIALDSGEQHWGLVYCPTTSRLFIALDNKRELAEYEF